ncbi:HSPB1-associated protein 1 [Drosophila subobscura]|uniref:HSPB1-associated protein 1 n=1 Tax=Drosophila subobscura TaxID=7241 RepID=UPI00155A36A1|nr:HSPB1-associated protein 1 [Drosophila subobscura]
MDNELSAQLRDLILNTRVPLMIEDFPRDWECFRGLLYEWCERFDKKAAGPPAFERMSLTDCSTPQWERKRTKANMSMLNFLRDYGCLDARQTHWAAYQYKRAHEMPASCLKGIDFSCFGFPDHQNDFTFWLGSEQANTPCHYDTFGVNIVVQVYGSKSWLLFPPETPLQSTRVPYEESSVYCLDNFYAPAEDKLPRMMEYSDQAHQCTLEEGDVLIVPRHWWHYVEATACQLSVNYWVPLKDDMDLALDEFLVKHIVESFVKGESEQTKRYLLNPNQLEDISATPSELFAQFQQAVQNAEGEEQKRKLWETDYLTESSFRELLNKVPVSIRPVEVLPKEEYKLLLESNSERRQAETATAAAATAESAPISSTLELLISSMCAPRTIAGMKREFFRRMRQGDV